MSPNETIKIDLYLHWETDGAFIVSDSDGKDGAIWLPRCKHVDIGDRIGPKIYEFKIAAWLAMKEGLI